MKDETKLRGSSVGHAAFWGFVAATLVMAGIYLGSRQLRDFDAALVAYAGASVFSAYGIGYRYAMWLRRPPTRLYWWRGWQTFLQHLPRNIPKLFVLAWDNLIAQRFIEKRSRLRWLAHMFIAWGCILAAAVTFPLSFGWVRFESEPSAPLVYDAFVFGFRAFRFASDGPLAPLVFNVLDVAAVMVLAGISLAFLRRIRDRGAVAVQDLTNDLLPLMLLFAVSVTGLFLTFSTHVMHGIHYAFLSELHAVTVIFTLLYLPFGKFFHVFQRPAQLSIKFYKDAGKLSGEADCVRCGLAYASKLHVADLKKVEAALAIRYAASGAHYQDVCPACRRKMLAIAQDGLWRAARTANTDIPSEI
ncbi:MAG: MFS transporter [Polyangiaceae bacterium]